jgi:hypothetical protein
MRAAETFFFGTFRSKRRSAFDVLRRLGVDIEGGA